MCRKKCPWSLEEVEQYADAFRQEVERRKPGLRGKALTDWLLDKLGGEAIVPSMWGRDHSGSLVVRGPRDFTIHLSPYTSPLRDVFTVAHERGHYCLHYDFERGGEARFNRIGSNLEEWQANRFAAALLMPKDEFKRQWIEYKKNPWMVGACFGVSSAAARVRAETLGLEA